MKPWTLLLPALLLLAALPLLAEDAEAPEEEGDDVADAPSEAGDGTVSAATSPEVTKEELLSQLKAALAKPETAASAVRELGPKINNCEAIKLILKAADTHGKTNADLLAACKDAIRQMDVAEAVHCLAGLKRMSLSSAGEALAYEILGDLKIEDGPAPSPTEKSLYEQRRDVLLTGLSTSYNPITVAAAESLARTGDKKAVGALAGRIEQVAGTGQKAVGSALQTLTGQGAKDPAGWKSWYDSEGFSAFPAATNSTKGGEGAAAAEEAWEAQYYGIPIKSSKGMSFVLDASMSMSPEKDPNPTDFPKAAPGVNNPQNWVEQDKSFDSKDQLAKYELISTILQLPESAKFNIVWFGGKLDAWPQEGQTIQATIENKNRAVQRVLDQSLSWGTKLIEGMESAWKVKDLDVIFLLSDGKPEKSHMMNPDDVIKTVKAESTGARKIVVNTVDMNALPWLYKNRWKKEAHTGLCASLANATGGKTVVLDAPKSPFTVKTKVYRGPK